MENNDWRGTMKPRIFRPDDEVTTTKATIAELTNRMRCDSCGEWYKENFFEGEDCLICNFVKTR
jgi:hypothetical protein